MARYFFHLRDGTDELLDADGMEVSDLETVRSKALFSARDTLSHDIRDGLIDLRYRIDVEDIDGKLVHSLPLGDAFQITWPAAEAA